jgi:hypothetical protein
MQANHHHRTEREWSNSGTDWRTKSAGASVPRATRPDQNQTSHQLVSPFPVWLADVTRRMGPIQLLHPLHRLTGPVAFG